MTSPQPVFTQQPPPPPPRPSVADGPWTRSSTDRVVAGVCGGLGRRLGVDPVILRVVVAVLAFFAGAGVVLYAAAWLFMPLDRTNQSVLSDAFGSDSRGRTRNVLTAVALLLVLVIATGVSLDSGFVPGILIAIVVVAVLLIARRDEAAARTAQPTSGPYGGFPATPGPQSFGEAGPAYGTYGSPAYRPPAASSFASSPTTYPPGGSDAEPTVATRPDSMMAPATGTEPTVVTGAIDPTVAYPRLDPGPIPPPSTAPGMVPPWQPPFVQSQPAYVPPLPPPPPRERSYLGLLTVSAMVAVLGAMSIIDLAGAAVPLAGYIVAALGVVAAGLVLGAWVGRSRGLIALGILLGLALGPGVVVDTVAGAEWRDWSSADDVRLAPSSVDGLQPAYDYSAGSFRMDLTDVDFTGEDVATMIDMAAGEIIITVPPDVDVFVNGNVAIGDLTLFNHHSSGFDANDSFNDLGADGAGGGRLDLSIDLGLGNVEVRRATS